MLDRLLSAEPFVGLKRGDRGPKTLESATFSRTLCGFEAFFKLFKVVLFNLSAEPFVGLKRLVADIDRDDRDSFSRTLCGFEACRLLSTL